MISGIVVLLVLIVAHESAIEASPVSDTSMIDELPASLPQRDTPLALS